MYATTTISYSLRTILAPGLHFSIRTDGSNSPEDDFSTASEKLNSSLLDTAPLPVVHNAIMLRANISVDILHIIVETVLAHGVSDAILRFETRVQTIQRSRHTGGHPHNHISGSLRKSMSESQRSMMRTETKKHGQTNLLNLTKAG